MVVARYIESSPIYNKYIGFKVVSKLTYNKNVKPHRKTILSGCDIIMKVLYLLLL